AAAALAAGVAAMGAAKRNDNKKARILYEAIEQFFGVKPPDVAAKLLTQKKQARNRLDYELPKKLKYLIVSAVDETSAADAESWIKLNGRYPEVRAILLFDDATPRTLLVRSEEEAKRDEFVRGLVGSFRGINVEAVDLRSEAA